MNREPIRQSLGIHPDLDTIVPELLRSASSEECSSLEELTDLADETLPDERRAAVLQHLRVCAPCASVALSIRQEFAPVRKLHSGWLGWRGPLWTALGRLDRESLLANAWQQHVDRCPRCRVRSERLSRLRHGRAGKARRGGLSHTLTFAIGAAFTLLVIQLAGPLGTLSGNIASGGGVASHVVVNPPPEIVPKGIESSPGTSDDIYDSQQVIKLLTQNPGVKFDDVVLSWQQAAKQDPEALAPLAVLRDLYSRKIAKEVDPKKRREWEEKRAQVTAHLGELLNRTSRQPKEARP